MPTTLHILGAGTPHPTPFRFGSSSVLEIDGEFLMFDCGPATTHKLVKAGLWPTRIDNLFFTHHHFDHDIDYPCFLLCRWDQSIGKENTLNVYGPPPTERLTHGILDEDKGVFAHDWYARVHFPISQNVYVNRGGTLPRDPPVVYSRDIGPGIVRTAEKWKVTAARASHVQPYLESLAYRVDTASGKSLVITGDTEPCDTVIDLAQNADIMLANCANNQSTLENQGLDSGQSGTIAAAQIAQTANVKTLVLTHMGPTFATHGPLEKGLGDIRQHYEGQVIFAEELMKLDV